MAVVHPSVQVPAGLQLVEGEDVGYDQFRSVIEDPNTTIAELFAVLRLWEPLIQEKVGAVAYYLFKKGAGVNDRDSLTDMSILHFACKSGAQGVGSDEGSAKVVSDLLKQGADANASSAWTKMTPLHYASFFGSAAVIEVLATEAETAPDFNATCTEFEGATPLHLAAMAGAPAAVAMLLEHGADPFVSDEGGRSPVECVKLVSSAPGNATPDATWDEITRVLKSKMEDMKAQGYKPAARLAKAPAAPTRSKAVSTPSRALLIPASDSGKFTGETAGVGDRVIVNGGYHGTVKFRGPVSFDKSGDWIGVQLDTPDGKNNGIVAGVSYFRCKVNHGLFIRPKACKVTSRKAQSVATPRRRTRAVASTPKATPVRNTFSTPRAASASRGRPGSARKPASTPSSSRKKAAATPGKGGFGIGSKVFVAGKLCTVQYIGSIGVAPGVFVGCELPDPTGKNDGSLEGQRYFSVRPNHGLFVKPDRCTWRGFKVSTLI